MVGPTEATGKARDEEVGLPVKYFVVPIMEPGSLPPELKAQILEVFSNSFVTVPSIPWHLASLKVYGRKVMVPRTFNKVAYYTFAEICAAALGPADYITLTSTFHTFIITGVPVLTASLKNEARRFITLLDALYEAKCKLLISAQVDPDNLFFPELRPSAKGVLISTEPANGTDDATYAETFSDIHQDLTAPFRPNVSSYENNVDTTHSCLQGLLAEDALEDDPPNKIKRMLGRTDSDFQDDEKLQVKRTPNFANTSIFTGEDEKFAYKRATSRLWEMCSTKWWERCEEGWWRPLPIESRGWERGTESSMVESPGFAATVAEMKAREATIEKEGIGNVRDVSEKEDEIMFRQDPNLFRTNREPPPKISWTHIWGTMRWGKKAGAWGKGVEGLKDRKKDVDG
jgi:predicted ATPase